MRKSLLAALVAAVAYTPVFAQTEVEPYKPGSTIEGVTYFLPRTAFRVTIKAERTIVRPGDLCRYAERYMSMKDVPMLETTQWKITDVKLEPFGVADPNKAYSIKLKGRTVAPLVGLADDGVLLSINTEAEIDELPELPKAVPADPLPDPRAFMTKDMLSAGSTSKLAELVAQEIYDIRDSRNELLRGESDNLPKDGAQLKLMLDRLDQQTSVLESFFAGTRQTSQEIFSMVYTPTEETDRMILFRFSEKLGIVGADDLAGEPVYVSCRCTDKLPASVQDEQAAKKKAKMQQGVYYNEPRRAKLTVFTPQKEFVSVEQPMGQFGNVEILANTLFDKKTTTKVTFFQQTGGVKDIYEKETAE